MKGPYEPRSFVPGCEPLKPLTRTEVRQIAREVLEQWTREWAESCIKAIHEMSAAQGKRDE